MGLTRRDVALCAGFTLRLPVPAIVTPVSEHGTITAMDLDGAAKVIEATARLIGALAWPAVALFALRLAAPAAREFLSSLGEFRLKGAGFEATATRRHITLDAGAQKLHEFWQPGGVINQSNAATIAACMRQLGIGGSVSELINAGTVADRARVVAGLGLGE